MKIRILCSILLILLALACTTMPETKIDDLKEKIMKANLEIDSFKFKSTATMKIEGKEESMDMDMEMDGAFDRTAKQFMVTGIMKMADMTLPIKTFSDGDWVYTETMGQWIKMQILSPEMFDQQDQAKYLIEFLENSEITTEEVTVDGTSYYKIDVVPDKDAFLDLAQKNSPAPLDDILDLEELFKNMEIVYYVNKETYVADKVDMKYQFKITDAIMTADTHYEMYDLNQPQTIVIPEEAKEKAIDFSELQAKMAQGPVSEGESPDSKVEITEESV